MMLYLLRITALARRYPATTYSLFGIVFLVIGTVMEVGPDSPDLLDGIVYILALAGIVLLTVPGFLGLHTSFGNQWDTVFGCVFGLIFTLMLDTVPKRIWAWIKYKRFRATSS